MCAPQLYHAALLYHAVTRNAALLSLTRMQQTQPGDPVGKHHLGRCNGYSYHKPQATEAASPVADHSNLPATYGTAVPGWRLSLWMNSMKRTFRGCLGHIAL